MEVLEAENFRSPILMGLKGDPRVTLSLVVVGAVPITQGRLTHVESAIWRLSPRSVEALTSQEELLPSPAGLANGLAKLMRECVHPHYGDAGWVS